MLTLYEGLDLLTLDEAKGISSHLPGNPSPIHLLGQFWQS